MLHQLVVDAEIIDLYRCEKHMYTLERILENEKKSQMRGKYRILIAVKR